VNTWLKIVGNIQSSLGQELLDVTKAEREASIHPDRHLDDGRWKTVTTIGVLVHAQIRSTRLSDRQRDKAESFISALGLTMVDLLGFSLGGMVAQVLAAHHPGLIRKVL
jgi:pimeloyl-ACP methyl ester carboxylesterase